mmetsp:Transcript_7499/g.7392  ORF Transcript_7499/g.7392 Transcript_7499/m.7392 type:complete len:124 (+) Transcript_7499:47-418(+)
MSTCNPFARNQCGSHGVCFQGFTTNFCACERWWDGDRCERLSAYFWIWMSVGIAAVLLAIAAFVVYWQSYRKRKAAAAANPRPVAYATAYAYPTASNGVVYSQAQPVVNGHMTSTVGNPVVKY